MLKTAIWLSYVFLFSELILLLIKHSARKSTAKKNDRGSLILLWLVIVLGLTAGFNLAKYRDWDSINYLFASAGLVMIVSGLAIRWTAIIQLNKAFTVNVAISSGHELKRDGLYGIVRHPSYLGLLLFMTGEALAMNRLISFLIVFIPICLVILYRIRVEEKLLEEFFGDTYRIYKLSTRRIIPFIY